MPRRKSNAQSISECITQCTRKQLGGAGTGQREKYLTTLSVRSRMETFLRVPNKLLTYRARGVAANESQISQGWTHVRDRMPELSSEWPPTISFKISQLKVHPLVVNYEFDVKVFCDATISDARGHKPSSTYS